MMWYDVVWCGMTWYDVIWRCRMCYDMVWCGMTWYDVVICGMIWYDVVWCGMMWYDMVLCSMMWYDVVWCGMMWYGVLLCDMIWYDVVWCAINNSTLNIAPTTTYTISLLEGNWALVCSVQYKYTLKERKFSKDNGFYLNESTITKLPTKYKLTCLWMTILTEEET